MSAVLGLDPGQRHVGLCLLPLGGGPPLFNEVTTDKADIYTSGVIIDTGLRQWFSSLPRPDLVSIERQGSAGASSQLMFLMMYIALRVVYETWPGIDITSPLPNQLKSYARHKYNIMDLSKSGLVKGYKSINKTAARISSHKVDAWFLARLGQDVLAGTWKYKQPANELPLTPKAILYGG